MEDNEWETIQASSSATQSDEDVGDAVVVATPTNFHDASGVAPSNHEGLLVFTQPPQDDYLHEPVLETPSPRSSYSSSSNPSSTEIVEGELPQPPETRNTQLKASFRILSSWVLRIAYGIRDRIGFWSIASVTAFASVMVYGMQWQRRRMLAAKESKDQLKLLINQKDEIVRLVHNGLSFNGYGRQVFDEMLRRTDYYTSLFEILPTSITFLAFMTLISACYDTLFLYSFRK